MKRALGVLSAGVLLAASGVVVALPADAGTARIAWKKCANEQAGFECGTLAVPIDRSKPGGPTFELAMNRHKATDPAHRVGVLFVNPGGPGGSGVQFAYDSLELFSPQIVQRFDIIGMDPRGVGDSKPVVCDAGLLAKQHAAVYPKTAVEFAKLVALEKQLRADCRQKTGPVFDHLSSADVADDMDALRGALGEAKLNYYGISYGTLFGQVYAERHGDRVRAMVIDANMDHSLDAHAFLTAEARAVEDSLKEWAKWNQRTASSPLHGQDALKIWDGLMAKADRGELIEHTPDGDQKVSPLGLTRAAGGMGYGPDWLPFTEGVKALQTGSSGARRMSARADDAVPEAFAASLCSDFNFPIRDFKHYQQLASAERKNAPHARGSDLGHMAVTACLGSAKAGNPQHTPKINTTGKVLVLNSLHDPATPYEWAAALHRAAKASTVLLTYEGWGHGAYEHTTCTRSNTDNYLTALKVPADNTRCAAQDPAASAKSRRTEVLPRQPF
ncbi:alpha/beta hydrolase [Kribbella sp. NBC_01505]|uniref:alpha/beta fold hydrolase n=1 Tax=Kribbella sp. NBC_01505 TaxID=2903580 RepID=UPI00386B6A01